MTIAEMRALMDLGEDVSDAQVVERYALYLGAMSAPEDGMGPVSLAEVKAQLRLETDDTTEDAYLSVLIAAAAAQIETATGIVTVPRAGKFAFDGFGAGMSIDLRPIDMDTLTLSYVGSDGSAVELSDFRAVPKGGLIWLEPAIGATWPVAAPGSGTVTATAMVGYSEAAAPPHVKAAALLLVAHWYANREAVTVGAVPAALPLSAQWLLDSLGTRRV